MGRRRNEIETADAVKKIERPSGEMVRIKFLAIWSGPRGYFAPGSIHSLPAEIAESLIAERAAELAEADVELAEADVEKKE